MNTYDVRTRHGVVQVQVDDIEGGRDPVDPRPPRSGGAR